MPWTAFTKASQAQGKALAKTVFLKSLEGVFRAGGMKSATVSEHRPHCPLIEADEGNNDPFTCHY
jgi:hypothetical protein